MSKTYRVKKLTKKEAECIEEILFGGQLATGSATIVHMNDEMSAQLTVGYDSLKGMMCAGLEVKGDTYVTYDQALIRNIVQRSADESTSSMHDRIYQDGKTVKANTDFDILKDGGRLAGHWVNSSLDNVADGPIYVTRKNEVVNDDSSAYIYNELQKINGSYSKEKVTKAHVNELLRSASSKAAELLLPVTGDTIASVLRRSLTFNTFFEFCVNKGGDDFTPYIEAFRDAVIEDMKGNEYLPGIQAEYLKKEEIPSYKRKTELSLMIAEEKEIIKTLGMETDVNPPVPKNFIDIMYVTELIDTMMEEKENLSTSLYHGYIFDTDRIVAGARLSYAIGETLLADIAWTNGDMGPAVDTNTNSPQSIVKEFLNFLADNGVEDTQAMYNQYFHNGKTFGQDFLERMKKGTLSNDSKLEQIFHGKKAPGSKFKKNNSDEFTAALNKLSKNKNKGKGEDNMRITSKGKGFGKSKNNIKEYTMDGETYYVDFDNIRDFDGTEAAIVYNADEEIIGAMAEDVEAIDTDGKSVGKLKEKSSSDFGSKSSSGFGSKKSSGFGSKSSSGFGKKSSSGFGSKKTPGVPCMVPGDDATVYYVTDNKVEAYGIDVLEIVDEDKEVVGGVTEDGELMDLEGNNIGDIILEEEEEKSSGFGKKSSSGFGSKSSSGFGKKSSSGFGSKKSSGFGKKSSSGFGKKSSSGFGSELKDNPASSSLRQKLNFVR